MRVHEPGHVSDEARIVDVPRSPAKKPKVLAAYRNLIVPLGR
jgi:hypothetical protein